MFRAHRGKLVLFLLLSTPLCFGFLLLRDIFNRRRSVIILITKIFCSYSTNDGTLGSGDSALFFNELITIDYVRPHPFLSIWSHFHFLSI